MAYDAVISAPPPQGAGKAAGAAARTQGEAAGQAQSPFGALMAILDAAAAPVASAAPTAQPSPDVETAAVPAASGTAEPQAQAVEDEDAAVEILAVVVAPDPSLSSAPVPLPGAPTAPPAQAMKSGEPQPAAAAPAAVVAASEGAEPVVAALVVEGDGLQAPASAPQLAAPAKSALAAVSPETADAAAPTTGDLRRAEAQAREPGAGNGQSGAPNASIEGAQASNGRSSGEQPGERAFNDPRTQTVNESQRGAAVAETGRGAEPALSGAPASSSAAPVQAAAQAQTPAVIATVAAAIPVRGAPEAVAQFAAQLIQKLDGQTTRFDLALNPRSLGRVDVRIEIDRAGALRAHMTFDTAQAAQEIGGRQAELRAVLQNAGFNLAEGDISFDLAQNGGASGGGPSWGGSDADPDRSGGAARLFQGVAQAADAAPAALQSYFTRAAASGVDIRV